MEEAMRTTHGTRHRTRHRTRHTTRRAAIAGLIALAAGFGSATAASAQEPEPPTSPEPTTTAVPADPAVADPAASTTIPAPSAAPTTFTLPLFGAALTIDVTTGPGGHLSSVAVNPADGFTATTLKPNRVRFVNDEGTASVVVKARHGGQRVEAKAGSLAEISGAGGWTGDVFDNGSVATVAFTIGDRGDGTPDIIGTTASGPANTIGAVEYGARDGGVGARQAIEFTDGTHTRTLVISAGLKTLEDGTTRAAVRVSLSRIHGDESDDDAGDAGGEDHPVVTLAPIIAGAQQWSGTLCDGTTATIDYTVAADGTVSGVVVNPAPAKQNVEKKRIEVRFAAGEQVKIRITTEDGTLAPKVDAKLRCTPPTPTVNTPISPTVSTIPAGVPVGGRGGDGKDGQGKGGDDARPKPSVPGSVPAGGSTTVPEEGRKGGKGKGRGGDPTTTTAPTTTAPAASTTTTVAATTSTAATTTSVAPTTVPAAPSTEPSTTNV
jgi:hypothetical protein